MVTIEVRDDDQLTVSEHLGSLSISEGSISTLTSSNRRKRGSFAVSEASSERTLGRVNLEIQPPRKENLPKPVEFLLPEDDDQLTVSDHFSESQYSPSASGKAVLSSSSNHSKGSNTSFKVSEKDLGKTGAPKISSLPYTSTTTSKIPPLYLKGKKANPQETIQACIASYQSMKHPSESGNAIVRQMSDIIQRYFPAGQKMMNIIQLEYGIKFRLDGLLREEATIKKEEAQIENDEAKIKKDEDELNENPVSTQQNKEAALRQLAEAPSENVQYIIQLKEYLAELESDENTIAELKAQIAISKADIQLKKAEIQMRKVRISQARNAIKKDGIRVCKLKVELNLDVDSSIDYCEWFQNFHALLSLNEKPISAEERQKALDNAELGLNSVTAQK
jgi:molecular chaperone DnaK (HSP70)